MPKDKKLPFHTLNEFDLELSGGVKKCTTIEPVFKNNYAAIALVSSDEYAPFASVVIASIIANSSKKHNYDIVVLTDDMLQRNRWRIQQQGDEFDNISIRVLDISQIIEGLSFFTWAHFTSNTYYRLLTPDVFKKYDKVIYLDSDIIVNHDIYELYTFELGGNYLGATYDTHVVSYCTRKPPLEQREYNIKKLGMDSPEQYFQAGVSVFNIKEINHDFEEGYLIKEGLQHKLRWLDQDLLNKLFYGKIAYVPNKWNVMVSNLPDNLDEYYLPKNLRTGYYNARLDPYIVHYVGRTMPCYTTTPDLYEYFWKYARQTVFYEILLQRMAIDYAEKLAESVRIQRRRHSLRYRLKQCIKHLIDFVLPHNSKRRIYVKRFVFKFKKWE